MRLAALYDIHGNAPALEAVLEEAGRLQVELIVVGGDVVAGPMPRETLALLLECKIPMRFVRGNADRGIAAAMQGQASGDKPEPLRETAAWVAGQLDPRYQALLAGWPATLRLSAGGLGEILFCHATPGSDTLVFTRLTPEARLRPLFSDVGAALVVCGHTHMQFDRQIGDVRVVNAGSVGMPYGRTGAHWLLIDADVEFKHTAYDLEKAAALIRATGYPEAEDFASSNVLSAPSEAEALELFKPMALGGSRL
jgi:putative phosphoesterase